MWTAFISTVLMAIADFPVHQSVFLVYLNPIVKSVDQDFTDWTVLKSVEKGATPLLVRKRRAGVTARIIIQE